MVMIDEETLRLFEANTAFRHGGDAERLRLEHKPEGVASVMDIPYVGESDPSHDVLHKLDVHRPADIPTKKPLPVIMDFHGGGLYHGDKRNTTCRDMLFAKHGFAVVNANYRLVPQVSFRDQLADAVRALDWIARNTGSTRREYSLPGIPRPRCLTFICVLFSILRSSPRNCASRPEPVACAYAALQE